MYVCKLCHKVDIDATECSFTFEIHEYITGAALMMECDVCGKKALCVFCDDYQAESITRALALEGMRKP